MNTSSTITLPTSGRVPQDNGSTKSLKMSMGKRLTDGEPDFQRMLYQYILLNGTQYCRPHLLIRCHLCESDGWSIKEEADQERRQLGLRNSGDPALDQRAHIWSDITKEALLTHDLRNKALIQQYGKNHGHTHPQHWKQLVQEMKTRERAINDECLTENPEVSQCCYWACQQPKAGKLLRCSGCGIAKYCCKEHQTADWKWEHKGECRTPTFLAEEYAANRARNLAGDYRTRNEM